ncbi:MAG TPA: Gx transporter family protein [Firmicutes bacterium]|nr:Gx transporter family protein [Bacillota bacterium]
MGGQTRRLLHLSLLVAGGTALHVFEGLLPALGALPGAKLGLANLVTLLALTLYGPGATWWVVSLRVLLGSLLGGTLLTTTFFLSLAGAVGSTLVMMLAFHLGRGALSIMGVSVLGAVAHNVSQLLLAALLIHHLGIFFYLPYLLLFALPTGCFIGITASYVLRLFPPAASSHRWKKDPLRGVVPKAWNM